MDQIILGSGQSGVARSLQFFSRTFFRFVIIKILLHAQFYYFLFILTVA